MRMIFDYFRGFLSLGAGVLSYMYGDMNGLLVTLCVVIVLDYISGLFKASITKTLSSAVGFKGILKKLLILMVVAMAHMIDNCVGSGETWRNIVIVFYICNEGLSILENAVASGLPVPEKLKEVLKTMDDENNEKKGVLPDGSKDDL